MPTPYSSATPNPYASIADWVVRMDERRLRDLTRDDDTRESGSLTGNATLQALLDDAAAEVESSALVGGRYAVADLAALAADPTGVGKNLVKRLVIDLAYGYGRERRYPDEQPPAAFKRAQEKLADLRTGKAVFGLREQVDASQIEPVDLSVQTPSGQVQVSQRARRFFGARSNQTPPNQNVPPCGW